MTCPFVGAISECRKPQTGFVAQQKEEQQSLHLKGIELILL
jgi:hypothetical protein